MCAAQQEDLRSGNCQQDVMISWGHGWQRADLSQVWLNRLRYSCAQPEIWDPEFLSGVLLSLLVH